MGATFGATPIVTPAAAAQRAEPPNFRNLSAAHLAACNHFANRARFKARGRNAELVVILADSCSVAIDSLTRRLDTRPTEAARARAYLDRLLAFKTLIIAMNVGRIYGDDPAPRAKPVAPPGGPRPRPIGHAVTQTGEYLIAREVGLLRVWQNWYRAGPDFAGPTLPPR
ncbi:MAG: hypothetical protein AAGC92_15795 [Pseudomonadota bacterium]